MRVMCFICRWSANLDYKELLDLRKKYCVLFYRHYHFDVPWRYRWRSWGHLYSSNGIKMSFNKNNPNAMGKIMGYLKQLSTEMVSLLFFTLKTWTFPRAFRLPGERKRRFSNFLIRKALDGSQPPAPPTSGGRSILSVARQRFSSMRPIQILSNTVCS